VLCPECKQLDPHAEEKMHSMGFKQALTVPVYQAKEGGCEACRQTGYRGRMSIYELVRVTPGMSELITSKSGSQALMQQAVADGYRPMREYGLRKVLEGITSLDEVISVTVAE
jgi:type II secretory ATPase GspE/PulE/Tfp pilus assembly ATPase PilB-like protein